MNLTPRNVVAIFFFSVFSFLNAKNINDTSLTVNIKVAKVIRLGKSYFAMQFVLKNEPINNNRLIEIQLNVLDKYYDQYHYTYLIDPNYFNIKYPNSKEWVVFNVETRDTVAAKSIRVFLKNRQVLDSSSYDINAKGFLLITKPIKKSSVNILNISADFKDVYVCVSKDIEIKKLGESKNELIKSLNQSLTDLALLKRQRDRYIKNLYTLLSDKQLLADSVKFNDTLSAKLNKYEYLFFGKAIDINNKITRIKTEINQLDHKLSDLHNEQILLGASGLYKKFQNQIAECANITFKSSSSRQVKVTAFIYNPKAHNLHIDYNSSIQYSIDLNYERGENPLFLTNGGMFHEGYLPVGLLVIDKKRYSKLNTSSPNNGENFYLLPNGLFFTKDDGEGKVLETMNFKNGGHDSSIKYASQSGPMLIMDDALNSNFTFHSSNDKIRSGVGQLNDGKLVFLVSEGPINFYDFALLFQFGFGCKNALFLDGAISESYANIGERNKISGKKFGSVITVSRK
jgi:uncharacterized protein YigE (DUF2233 family)